AIRARREDAGDHAVLAGRAHEPGGAGKVPCVRVVLGGLEVREVPARLRERDRLELSPEVLAHLLDGRIVERQRARRSRRLVRRDPEKSRNARAPAHESECASAIATLRGTLGDYRLPGGSRK